MYQTWSTRGRCCSSDRGEWRPQYRWSAIRQYGPVARCEASLLLLISEIDHDATGVHNNTNPRFPAPRRPKQLQRPPCSAPIRRARRSRPSRRSALAILPRQRTQLPCSTHSAPILCHLRPPPQLPTWLSTLATRTMRLNSTLILLRSPARTRQSGKRAGEHCSQTPVLLEERLLPGSASR